jgi:hypothetical protein
VADRPEIGYALFSEEHAPSDPTSVARTPFVWGLGGTIAKGTNARALTPAVRSADRGLAPRPAYSRGYTTTTPTRGERSAPR